MKNNLLFALIILNITMLLISGIIIFKEYLITHTKTI
jgi:hypothetical protein